MATLQISEQDTDCRFKIFMLPWLAHGHVFPYLELAKRLSKRNFLIYFCSTPVILDSIKPTLSDKPSNIKLIEIHLDSTPDLPSHFHTTNALPIHLMPILKNAFEFSAPKLVSILKNIDPHLLIVDLLMPWLFPFSSSLNIPTISFAVHGAIALSFYFKRYSPYQFPSPEINIHDYWKSKLPDFYGSQTRKPSESESESQPKRELKKSESTDVILIKSFREIEAKYIDFLSLAINKKVVTTGPLVSQPFLDDKKSDEIIEWLDKKQPFSTVFVSFGSEVYLSKEEIEEMAYGLESSHVNFIWVIRFPKGDEQKLELDEILPKGFIERVGEKGKVIKGWAAQTQILKHISVGGFVSHCGWSSLMETLMFGKPVICVPMQLDLPLYAFLMEDFGVGLEVKRDEKGRMKREEVSNVIKKVMTEGAFRNKAKEISVVLMKKDEEEIDGVVNELVKLCKIKKG